MTPLRPDLTVELQKLSRSHRAPSKKIVDKRIFGLNYMRNFYLAKIPEAPEKQGVMFERFVNALVFSISIINQYRDLTMKLSELVEGGEDETRPDSES